MFFFDFDWHYAIAMYNILYRNEEAVVEWFISGGRYCANEETLPPHAQIKPEDAMDIDHPGNIKVRNTPYSKKILEEEYDDIDLVGPSQIY